MINDIYDRPISERRRNEVVKTIIETVKSETLIRNLLKVRNSQERENEEFVKLGFNSIVDKIWFVDTEAGEPYYSYQGIGHHEGESIAEGERKILFDLLRSHENNKLVRDGKLTKEIVDEATSKLNERKRKCKFIISNIDDVFEFWYMGRNVFNGVMKIENKERGTLRLEGYYKGIPVYWDRLLPRGTLLFIDSDYLGEFVIKKELEALLTEIEHGEIEQIKLELPQLKDVNLKQKIRMYCEEIIKINILDKDSFFILNLNSESKSDD
ncbi:MAG: hypothetical protein V1802_00795 [Candidatus Aenigmatarchaeota archaeon]